MSPDTPRLDAAELLQHQDWLRRLLRAMVREQDVDDALHDTWHRALRSSPRKAGAVRAWLRKIAHNVVAARHLANSRRRLRERSAARAERLHSTSEVVEKLACLRQVTAAVMALPEPYRTAVVQRYYHDFSVSEIAHRTSTSEANVRARLSRGLARIRGNMGDDGRGCLALLSWLETTAISASSQGPPLSALYLMKNTSKIIIAVVALALFAVGVHVITDPATPTNTTDSNQLRAAPPTVASTSESTAPPPDARTPFAVPVAPTMRVSGRVVDALGAGVVDVRLILQTLRGERTRIGQSGESGTFELRLPECEGTLIAENPFTALRSAPLRNDGPRTGLLMVVAPAVAVEGVVVDAHGQPIAGVGVGAIPRGLSQFPFPLDTTELPTWSSQKTNEDGWFAFTALPGGAYTGLRFRKIGFTRRGLDVPRCGPVQLRVEMKADEGPFGITGTVTDTAGSLVGGAIVGLGSWRTRTDDHGRFELTIPASGAFRGAAPLISVAPNQRPGRIPGFGAKLRAERRAEVELTLGGPTLTMTGRVFDSAGDPLTGVWVYPWDLQPLDTDLSTTEGLASTSTGTGFPKGNRVVCRTDVDGGFRLVGLDDRRYRLCAFDPKRLLRVLTAPMAAGRGIDIRLPVDALRERVTGQVVNPSGRAMAGLDVYFYIPVFRSTPHGSRTEQGTAVKTDADGRFTLTSVPRRGAVILVTGAGILAEFVRIPVSASGENLVVRIQERCHLRVQLPETTTARYVEVHTAAGRQLTLTERHANSSSSWARWPLHGGRSSVLTTSVDAAFLVVFDEKGSVLDKHPIALEPGEVTIIPR